MKRSEILETSRKCVCGEREQDYGKPEDNFKRVAALWSAYTGHSFTAVDVAMMMALLKIARIKTGTGTADGFIDLAGYAACAGEGASENHHGDSAPQDTEKQEVIKCCGTCNHFAFSQERSGVVCTNPKGEYFHKYLCPDDSCTSWEEVNDDD